MAQKYQTLIDKRATLTRSQLRALSIRDLGVGTMRWALHLSELEAHMLEVLNPDTLGLPEDSKQRDIEWRKFIEHPDSEPFRIQRRI